MIEGESRYQEIVLSIRFTEVVNPKLTRQTVLLFEDQKGRLALPSIRSPLDKDLFSKFDKKYGLNLSNRGKVRIIDRQKRGLNMLVLDYQGVMGSLKGSDKYIPRYFPLDDIEEILENNELTKATQNVLILFLTKLALRGRLC